jgi:hypothetical protein
MASAKKVDWKTSEEKEQLRKDIINGVVKGDMKAEIVYQMHQGAYHKFKFERFKDNLQNLRNAIIKSKTAAEEDEFALLNTLQHWPAQVDLPPYPAWHGSVAKAYLLEDIESGVVEGVKTANVWQMRPEYKMYPLNVFRDHLNKEKKKPAEKGYWEHQRELKELKKRNKRK